MGFYMATLVELLIVEAFVFFIWLRVLTGAVRERDHSKVGKKLLLTSVGLVITSLAIFGIISVRVAEVYYKIDALFAVNGFYIALAAGSILFIISAAIENSYRIIWLFFGISAAWTAVFLCLSIT